MIWRPLHCKYELKRIPATKVYEVKWVTTLAFPWLWSKKKVPQFYKGSTMWSKKMVWYILLLSFISAVISQLKLMVSSCQSTESTIFCGWNCFESGARLKLEKNIINQSNAKKLRGKGSKVARGIFCVRLIHTQTTGGLIKSFYLLYLLLK